MTGRDDVLAPLARVDGLEVACLVDPASGGVLAGLPGPDDKDVQATAAGMADLAQVVWVMLSTLAAEDDAEDLVITTGSRHHIGRVVPLATGTVIIALTVDRTRTALGLALRALRDVEASLGG